MRPAASSTFTRSAHSCFLVRASRTGRSARELGNVTYKYIDQRGVDGIVNGIGIGTGEAGGAVRHIQTGRLQFYALMLVLAVGVFALVLWIAA